MEFRILGPLEVVGAAGEVELRAAKHRALLALLLIHANEVVSVDILVDALWSERPPPSVSKLVHHYVSQLRRALGSDGWIATRAPGYVLSIDPDELDSARFERLLGEGREALAGGNASRARRSLGEALALWRGPAFADLAYEDFARGEAERLEELRLAALEERIDADLALARHEQLIPELRALVERQPLRERLWRQLMLALYRSGRQAESLECFAEARARLLDVLGLEPGEELRELQTAILCHDPTLAAPAQADVRRTNLPAAVSPLLGRERELTELGGLLRQREVRLLTLAGAGGSGKTRLALEAARAVVDDFANGAVLVELAPVSDAALVPAATAAALAVDAAPAESPQQTLRRVLRGEELLLVVDNAEHLPAAGPGLVELLEAAPDLKVLVTSRSVLHLSGERVYPVAPLEPEPAVELFLARAQAAEPRFAPDPADEPLVAAICERVDRLPLAIELAAPRVRSLTLDALHQRLVRSLPLLTGGPRDLPARQQTLRATIDWSHDLLAPQEQEVFRRLAVFAGGFTIEAAEDVAGADLATVDALLELNLLRRGDDGRLLLLETVREYAFERLHESGEGWEVRRRHVGYFMEVARSAQPHDRGRGPDAARPRHRRAGQRAGRARLGPRCRGGRGRSRAGCAARELLDDQRGPRREGPPPRAARGRRRAARRPARACAPLPRIRHADARPVQRRGPRVRCEPGRIPPYRRRARGRHCTPAPRFRGAAPGPHRACSHAARRQPRRAPEERLRQGRGGLARRAGERGDERRKRRSRPRAPRAEHRPVPGYRVRLVADTRAGPDLGAAAQARRGSRVGRTDARGASAPRADG